ncbi:Molybdopterin synthase sulfur carrier subunit [hydrothermal vent metagenome]|uniref:Molybdopterin synthase sulfur carrier subunit n=1 Tax=hydrothermal vent metagenome TaxID=652676 RepID=A0A3B1AQT1_9ZZZZ
MSITVRFFASLRENLKLDDLQISPDGINTVIDAWNNSTKDQSIPENVLVAVNMEYVSFDTAIADGDEVAFFPPVTGG